ncbi:flavodoxin [Methanobacterium alkalithermotolerans]|uniref:Flavodoxin n=1 Tax=Methanobacterium alkalithermotolerans TaxID=2731220 RepID=A0A8T8K4S0_9EURY|nr:flavodoxin [Methanobacterium alkalithermotolerans]QUH22909.1 flavodoxin [Methanobacterium alkalithermotolerans]RJS48764.1 MAG: flavodoxin [Methanobacterium sp.]
MKTVVLYYSRSRKTASVAETIAQELSADIVEIKDLKDRSSFFSYLNASIDALRENKTKISPENIDLSDYGLIYIGSPTWAGKPAPAMLSLIDSCDFQGKDVILFTTMGSQGGRTVIKRMQEKIKARGSRMVNFLIIKTGGKEISEIKEDTRKKIDELDLKIYGI